LTDVLRKQDLSLGLDSCKTWTNKKRLVSMTGFMVQVIKNDLSLGLDSWYK